MTDNTNTSKFKKIIKLAVLLLLLLILWTPLLQSQFKFIDETTTTEKRTVAELPKFEIKNPYKYLSDFVKYFNDNFGFRNTLIGVNNLIEFNLLNTSTTAKVIIGQNGWLYYNQDNTIEDYLGLVPFSEKNLEEMAKNLELWNKMLKDKNIFFLLVIAPNKNTIYPEYLPENLKRSFPAKTRLDQATEYLTKYPDIHILDLREILIKEKNKFPVYYETDSHWNNYGAYLGCQEVDDILGIYWKNIETPKIETIQANTKKENADMTAMLGIDEISKLLPYTKMDLKLKETAKNTSNLSLVLFHDSFGYYETTDGSQDRFLWCLAPTFKKISHEKFDTNGLDMSLVDKEKPNVVIFEITERFLDHLLPPG